MAAIARIHSFKPTVTTYEKVKAFFNDLIIMRGQIRMTASSFLVIKMTSSMPYKEGDKLICFLPGLYQHFVSLMIPLDLDL